MRKKENRMPDVGLKDKKISCPRYPRLPARPRTASRAHDIQAAAWTTTNLPSSPPGSPRPGWQVTANQQSLPVFVSAKWLAVCRWPARSCSLTRFTRFTKAAPSAGRARSEERRVGKECRAGGGRVPRKEEG